MGSTALAIYEPIKPPAMDRPGTIPSLPEWLASLLAVCERTMTGKPEIAASRALVPAQRQLISNYIEKLEFIYAQTPENDTTADQIMLVTITKMLKALAGSKKQEAECEVKAEAYAVALEDVPAWAIVAAARGWYRGAYGPDHDYAWPPAPAVLRAAAVSEAKKLKGRMVELRNLLAAPLRPEYSDEYRAETLGRLRRLMVNSAAEQIGCADAAE
jgi:hypothetical protein